MYKFQRPEEQHIARAPYTKGLVLTVFIMLLLFLLPLWAFAAMTVTPAESADFTDFVFSGYGTNSISFSDPTDTMVWGGSGTGPTHHCQSESASRWNEVSGNVYDMITGTYAGDGDCVDGMPGTWTYIEYYYNGSFNLVSEGSFLMCDGSCEEEGGGSGTSTASTTTVDTTNQDFFYGLILFTAWFFGIYWIFSKRR